MTNSSIYGSSIEDGKAGLRLGHKGGVGVVRSSQKGSALVITLALLSVLVVIVVTLLSVSQLDFKATSGYSKSMSAEQTASASLNLVVAQLRMEMAKDAPPDTGGGTYPNSPIYTNVLSSNLLPQNVGANINIPSLVKMSTNAPFFVGGMATSLLQASDINTTTPSQNGRLVSLSRWGQSYFGSFPSTAQAPYWVLVTRNGPTNAAGIGFGTTGNTINNDSVANTNYALGRFAYAIYNEGGLLDITAAGTPTGITLTSIQQDLIKGMLAGADLNQETGITASTLTQWRNTSGGSGGNVSSYTNSLIAYAATNAAGNVYPGDTIFVSRQDLINAALSGQAGLTMNALTNLTTFTRELNRPSWAPSLNAPNSSYQYAATANAVTTTPFSSSSPNPNPLVPLVRAAQANAGHLAYHDDGTIYSDPIIAGDPVMRRRFSLTRLAWLGPNGPATINGNVISAAAIQSCFGLRWAANSASSLDSAMIPAGAKVWQYVGPTGSTEQSTIETLYQVAQENPSREPNFFEVLQAGILNGSLATDGGVPAISGMFSNQAQLFPAFQILRIGANIICQYNTDQYPRVIEYSPVAGDYWLAAGIQNLPYINRWWPLMGASPNDPNNSSNKIHYFSLQYLFGLWNPHQQNPGVTYARPPIRLCFVTGPSTAPGVGCISPVLTSPQGPPYSNAANGWWGYQCKIPANTTYVPLASGAGNGADGFLNPGLLTTADVGTGTPSFTSANGGGPSCLTAISTSPPGGWFSLSLFPRSSATLCTYRMPDLQVDLSQSAGASTQVWSVYNNFQVVLEYKDGSNNWIPYDYLCGINDTSTWQQAFSAAASIGLTEPASAPWTIPPDPAAALFTSTPAGDFTTSDPRTFRFNPWEFDGFLGPGPNQAIMDSLWSGLSLPGYYAVAGYGGKNENQGTSISPYVATGQMYPSKISSGNWYFPAVLCRNNAAPSAIQPATSYTDPDGTQRIADSGLFPLDTSNANSAAANAPQTGNPFWDPANKPGSLTGQTITDRPIILNRAFNHVADLGYAFRDDPWRSLDFFSSYNNGASNISTSADSGLLDLFSVREKSALITGRVDLNTQNIAALQSVLSQTVADVEGSAYFGGTRGTGSANPAMTSMSSTAVTQIATQLAAFTKTNPLVNKDQLVTRFAPTLGAATFGSSDEQNVKACREAFIRGLSDVGQTRTWNLMIDLVAQGGRFAPTATSLDQFVVESEKRYWLHVAIDRFTGEVIDQKLESVAP